METSLNQTTNTNQYFAMALAIVLACWALFYLDKDTHSISDLFSFGNLAVLVVYFVPALIICISMFVVLIKRFEKAKSIILSLSFGIPISFALTICFMLLLRN